MKTKLTVPSWLIEKLTVQTAPCAGLEYGAWFDRLISRGFVAGPSAGLVYGAWFDEALVEFCKQIKAVCEVGIRSLV
ncbi:MAG: hypothetical protein WBJ77_06000 [Bacillota bacterium]|nr:hypothetical protein [Bacillota bacterium]